MSPIDANYYARYFYLMSKIPEKGFEVEDFGEIGRGLRSLVVVKKNDPIGCYGGTHVTRFGDLIYCSPSMRAFFDRFPELDRTKTCTLFQQSHSVRMRTTTGKMRLASACVNVLTSFFRLSLHRWTPVRASLPRQVS